MIVFSSPVLFPGEASIVNSLFEAGMEIFHLRKKDSSEEELSDFLNQINPENWSKIVIHGPQKGLTTNFSECKYHSLISKSVHSPQELEREFGAIDYVFLSPVYESISKLGYKRNWKVEDLKRVLPNFRKLNPKAKLIALGGVNSENAFQTLDFGFDDIALLGALWENPSMALDSFLKIKKMYV
ncbi:MAG: thiamine-phosphate pyrophosphorylase [Sphingobacteriales bacterium]|jgi:thiamine-phosphate pyrophosphorylase